MACRYLIVAALVMTMVAAIQTFVWVIGGSGASAVYAVIGAWFAWVAERVARGN